jgi:transposase
MSPDEELQALRQENTTLKSLNAELQGKLAEASAAWEQMSQRVKELEERLAKDSHNSHLPPSSDRFSRQKKSRSLRKKSGKKAGGQPGHPGHHLALSDTPDEILIHRVEICEHCQQDLLQVAAHSMERRQILEVPPQHLLVREHQAERKWCPHCQQMSVASFPKQVKACVQYGESVGAMAVYLVQQHLLPNARAGEILFDLLGAKLCASTIQALVERCAAHLQPVEKQIKLALRQSGVIQKA